MPGTRVSGEVRVPGDKSLSHRALILSALADGPSRLRGILQGDDIQSTARILRSLGTDLPSLGDDIVIRGRGLRSLRAPSSDLDCGNSGTTARLTAGVVAGSSLRARFVGDESLSRRPMRRVAEPLRAMGAEVALERGDGLPMTVTGGSLHTIDWSTETPSAQVKSAILLAALTAGVPAIVRESARTRDHTERMLGAMGVSLEGAGTSVGLSPTERLEPLDLTIPRDPSSAAFFIALATLADDGELRLPDVCLNVTRTGFLSTLRAMGARITVTLGQPQGGEPVGTVTASAADLKGVEVAPRDVPAMIDELPLLACVAARARGETVITGAKELRVKESDRIAVIVENLRVLGVEADELEDGMRIRGSTEPLRGMVRTRGDHRIAMAFGILGALQDNQITVDDPHCVRISYPSFWDDLSLALR
ncbi:MAG TPA: 3-phosphoshikimate 1-carboxyvinyltransferase [Gemmatimonadaceae bacterium]|nr:3-phosphoshikimate 1-carboxyvinyltransferase [Gemmatimonadaceae bacterium]